jgi:hypothetical protein
MEKEIKEIIGFDLGHGDFAIASARISFDSNSSEPDPVMLEVNNQKHQITALKRYDDGQVVIGSDAVDSSSYEVSEFEVCFKQRPSQENSSMRTLQLFVETVYKELLEKEKIAANDCHFFVGCPSGWQELDRQSYEKILKQTGITLITVQPESRAAFLYGLHIGKLRFEQIKEGVLVIDIGSLTTDFTWVKELSIKAYDDGTNLGSSLIDRMILDFLFDSHEARNELKMACQESSNFKNMCLVRCRELKEEFFRTKHPIIYARGVRDHKYGAFHFDIEAASIKQIFDQKLPVDDSHAGFGKSWKQTFEDDLLQVRKHLENEMEATPKTIVLAGGPSRMQFVKDICKGVFDGAKVVTFEKEMECVVAKGLSLHGRLSYKIKKFRSLVEDFCAQEVPKRVSQNIPELIDRLAPQLAQTFAKNVAHPAMYDWQQHRVTTLNGLKDHMKTKAEIWANSPNTKNTIKGVVKEWFAPIEYELNQKIQDLRNQSNLRNELDGLLDFDVRVGLDGQLNLTELNNPDNVTFIVTIANLVTAAVIANLLFGGGIHLLLQTGPIAVIIAFLVGMAFLMSPPLRNRGEEVIRELNIPAGRNLILSNNAIRSFPQGKEHEKLTQSFNDMLITGDDSENLSKAVVKQISMSIKNELDKQLTQIERLI